VVSQDPALPSYYSGSVSTGNATPVNVLTNPYTIPAGKVALVEVWVTVKRADLLQSAAWHFVGLFRNSGGTVTQDGTTDFLNQPPQLQSGTWGGGVGDRGALATPS